MKDAPSEKGPTTDVTVTPASFDTTIFCGGTKQKSIFQIYKRRQHKLCYLTNQQNILSLNTLKETNILMRNP